MGKFLEKIGIKLQGWWCRFKCCWNWMVSKLLFNVTSCPYKMCECKRDKPVDMGAGAMNPTNMDGSPGSDDPYYSSTQD
jgi:hypothetical protein|tara:strand:- start:4827 stop:5063 length:237 start_codon:yes stop_codon:yes gene_type:complete